MKRAPLAKVRRFEMGCSGEGNDDFLKERGYTVVGGKHRATFKVIGPNGGRPKVVTRNELMKILDVERQKAGLEPIIRRD